MSLNYSINTYECVKNPKVVETLTIDKWLLQIKQSEYSDRITKARLGELDYNETKTGLPCVTYNFLFDGYKSTDYAISSTGLIYIDIDNPEFNIDLLDQSKVFAYYKSFGGNGYAIIVRVNGLTMDSFKASYLNIVNDLGINDYVDVQAIKSTQFNVLSYDKDLFVNENSFLYEAITPPPYVKTNKKEAYTIDGGAKEFKSLRFDNLDEILFDGPYTVNWDGYHYIRCFLPFNKVDKYRNNFLLSYCTNLVFLNPSITIPTTLQILGSVNHKFCNVPVDFDQLMRVVNSVHKYHKEGKLKPITHFKTRKIIFDKTIGYSKEEKLEICRAELSLKWAVEMKKKICDIIENWDFSLGKISQKRICKNHPISKKTVEKYWKFFKIQIEELNRINT
jgi:hypothetical protein